MRLLTFTGRLYSPGSRTLTPSFSASKDIAGRPSEIQTYRFTPLMDSEGLRSGPETLHVTDALRNYLSA